MIKNDNFLLTNDVNERSISHRLAVYLEGEFRCWDVDCEYNRNHDVSKRLSFESENIEPNDTHAATVFPDIIIHKRNSTKNLIVIEMKKTTSGRGEAYDLKKLRAFKDQLGYEFAIFVKIRTNGATESNGGEESHISGLWGEATFIDEQN